jgi:MFS family permease
MNSDPSRAPRAWLALPADDLFRDPGYRRLWLSVLAGGFGNRISSMATALTAVLLLHATPSQMGLFGALGALPYILLMLPAGVWLDRVRKLPVYIAGELFMALALASIPLAWALGWLDMSLLYAVAFAGGCVSVVAGTAGQVVLTQVVARHRLVEAHARNALATSAAEIAGPGVAGLLIRVIGAPLTLLADTVLLIGSVLMLRGIPQEPTSPPRTTAGFWRELAEGMRFVAGDPLLRTLAFSVAAWQVFQTAASVVLVLYAMRELGLNEYQLGFSYAATGIGTIAAGAFVPRISRRIGAGSCLILGFAVSGFGWLLLALAPAGYAGIAAFVIMLLCLSAATVLIFSNLLALRQSITPPGLLARMTSSMRWITLFPAVPGSLFGGWLGETLSLRHSIGFGGVGALLLAFAVWRIPTLRTAAIPPTDAERH